jgi:hypothetical protein
LIPTLEKGLPSWATILLFNSPQILGIWNPRVIKTHCWVVLFCLTIMIWKRTERDRQSKEKRQVKIMAAMIGDAFKSHKTS